MEIHTINMLTVRILLVIYYSFNTKSVAKSLRVVVQRNAWRLLMPLKKQKEIRKGKENKKMYYSHKKVNLELE